MILAGLAIGDTFVGPITDMIRTVGKRPKMVRSNSASAITEAEAASLISHGACMLDVRTRASTWMGTIPGTRWSSLARLWQCFHELPSDRPILIYSDTVRRAEKAKIVLEDVGFHAVNGGRFRTIAKIMEAQQAAIGSIGESAPSTH